MKRNQCWSGVQFSLMAVVSHHRLMWVSACHSCSKQSLSIPVPYCVPPCSCWLLTLLWTLALPPTSHSMELHLEQVKPTGIHWWFWLSYKNTKTQKHQAVSTTIYPPPPQMHVSFLKTTRVTFTIGKTTSWAFTRELMRHKWRPTLNMMNH